MPNPEILNARPDDPIRSAHNKDIAGAVSPMPHDLPEALTEKTRELNVFQNKRVMLSSDLGIGPHLSSSIEELIVKGGGTVTKNLDKADTYICRYREGPEYRAASRANKEVGNLAWLYYMITNNKWTSPLRRLLHYPVSREGIPGIKGLRISLSNYAGEARAYLEHLIIAAGAECTKTLKNDNTHLITAHGTSEKCSAAREWGLHVVNHLWLEESYAKWKMMPVSDPRYTHFPKRTNLGEVVGQTRLDRDVLERIFFPADSADEDARVMQQKDQNVVSKTETAKPSKRSSKEKSESDKKSNKASSAPAKPTTPSRTVAAEGKENATPLTTSTRKSKEAAAARLQEIVPDMLLYEKEKKRAGGVVYGGRRSEDLIVPNNGKKRRSIDAQETGDEAEEDKADAKRQKKTKTPIKMYMVVTGYERWAGNAKREDADRVCLFYSLCLCRKESNVDTAPTSRAGNSDRAGCKEVHPSSSPRDPTNAKIRQCTGICAGGRQDRLFDAMSRKEGTPRHEGLCSSGRGVREKVWFLAGRIPGTGGQEQEQTPPRLPDLLCGKHPRRIRYIQVHRRGKWGRVHTLPRPRIDELPNPSEQHGFCGFFGKRRCGAETSREKQ